MQLNPDIEQLIAKSGATIRPSGERWIVSNGSRACHGDTAELAAEAFLIARQPRQRDVIDRLTVIDTVVVTHEPAPKTAPDFRDAELAAARAEIAFLKACIAELEARPPRILIDDLAEIIPAPTVQEPEPVQDDLLGWDGGNAIGSVTSAELLDRMKTDRAAVADEIAGMSSADRTYFTEMLNVELAELQQKRGAAGENLGREADIEQLLGLFARVGEM